MSFINGSMVTCTIALIIAIGLLAFLLGTVEEGREKYQNDGITFCNLHGYEGFQRKYNTESYCYNEVSSDEVVIRKIECKEDWWTGEMISCNLILEASS